jgi:hypothetical protein
LSDYEERDEKNIFGMLLVGFYTGPDTPKLYLRVADKDGTVYQSSSIGPTIDTQYVVVVDFVASTSQAKIEVWNSDKTTLIWTRALDLTSVEFFVNCWSMMNYSWSGTHGPVTGWIDNLDLYGEPIQCISNSVGLGRQIAVNTTIGRYVRQCTPEETAIVADIHELELEAFVELIEVSDTPILEMQADEEVVDAIDTPAPTLEPIEGAEVIDNISELDITVTENIPTADLLEWDYPLDIADEDVIDILEDVTDYIVIAGRPYYCLVRSIQNPMTRVDERQRFRNGIVMNPGDSVMYYAARHYFNLGTEVEWQGNTYTIVATDSVPIQIPVYKKSGLRRKDPPQAPDVIGVRSGG